MNNAALGLFAFTVLSFAQTVSPESPVRQWRQQNERAILAEYMSLVSIPNVSGDRVNIQRNAAAIVKMLARRGVPAKLVSLPGANPVVFGEIKTPGATRTIGFYAHYDGQPVEPKDWVSPPFAPTLRTGRVEDGGRVVALPPAGRPLGPEWHLYARGAADDKAPIMAMLSSLDAIRSMGLKLRSNIKFAFEGEEEALSINLEKILAANKSLFAADVWLVCDAPTHQSRMQQIHFGARGVTALDLTIYGPLVDLHAGHYGNWAPNPADQLARLLVSMKDGDGRVVIDGFYEGIVPLNEVERKALADVPDVDAQLRDQFALGASEGGPAKLAELITRPALVIRGMGSGRTGAQAASVIPSAASASLVTYLVKGMDHVRTTERIVDHIRKQGFFVVDREPTPDVRRAHANVALINL